ncbi:MAG: hypothetical protein V1493_00850 [Candidatus Diapherotrites archaeon]
MAIHRTQRREHIPRPPHMKMPGPEQIKSGRQWYGRILRGKKKAEVLSRITALGEASYNDLVRPFGAAKQYGSPNGIVSMAVAKFNLEELERSGSIVRSSRIVKSGQEVVVFRSTLKGLLEAHNAELLLSKEKLSGAEVKSLEMLRPALSSRASELSERIRQGEASGSPGTELARLQINARNAGWWAEAIDSRLAGKPIGIVKRAKPVSIGNIGRTETRILERILENGYATYDSLCRPYKIRNTVGGRPDGIAARGVIVRKIDPLIKNGVLEIAAEPGKPAEIRFAEEGRAAYSRERENLLKGLKRPAKPVVDRYRRQREKLETRVLERIRKNGHETYDSLSKPYKDGGHRYGSQSGGITSVTTVRLVIESLLAKGEVTTRGTKMPVKFYITDSGEKRVGVPVKKTEARPGKMQARQLAGRQRLELLALQRIRSEGGSTYNTLSRPFSAGGYAYGSRNGIADRATTGHIIKGFMEKGFVDARTASGTAAKLFTITKKGAAEIERLSSLPATQAPTRTEMPKKRTAKAPELKPAEPRVPVPRRPPAPVGEQGNVELDVLRRLHRSASLSMDSLSQPYEAGGYRHGSISGVADRNAVAEAIKSLKAKRQISSERRGPQGALFIEPSGIRRLEEEGAIARVKEEGFVPAAFGRTRERREPEIAGEATAGLEERSQAAAPEEARQVPAVEERLPGRKYRKKGSEIRAGILEKIWQDGYATASSLSGISDRLTLGKYLSGLVTEGAVSKKKAGRAFVFSFTDAGRADHARKTAKTDAEKRAEREKSAEAEKRITGGASVRKEKTNVAKTAKVAERQARVLASVIELGEASLPQLCSAKGTYSKDIIKQTLFRLVKNGDLSGRKEGHSIIYKPTLKARTEAFLSMKFSMDTVARNRQIRQLVELGLDYKRLLEKREGEIAAGMKAGMPQPEIGWKINDMKRAAYWGKRVWNMLAEARVPAISVKAIEESILEERAEKQGQAKRPKRRTREDLKRKTREEHIASRQRIIEKAVELGSVTRQELDIRNKGGVAKIWHVNNELRWLVSNGALVKKKFGMETFYEPTLKGRAEALLAKAIPNEPGAVEKHVRLLVELQMDLRGSEGAQERQWAGQTEEKLREAQAPEERITEIEGEIAAARAEAEKAREEARKLKPHPGKVLGEKKKADILKRVLELREAMYGQLANVLRHKGVILTGSENGVADLGTIRKRVPELEKDGLVRVVERGGLKIVVPTLKGAMEALQVREILAKQEKLTETDLASLADALTELEPFKARLEQELKSQAAVENNEGMQRSIESADSWIKKINDRLKAENIPLNRLQEISGTIIQRKQAALESTRRFQKARAREPRRSPAEGKKKKAPAPGERPERKPREPGPRRKLLWALAELGGTGDPLAIAEKAGIDFDEAASLFDELQKGHLIEPKKAAEGVAMFSLGESQRGLLAEVEQKRAEAKALSEMFGVRARREFEKQKKKAGASEPVAAKEVIESYATRINKLRDRREAAANRQEQSRLWKQINELIGDALKAGVPRSELEKR